VVWLFFKTDLCLATYFKRSRRELSIDVAEHRSTLKSKREMRILVIFQDRPMISHIIQKVSARTFDWCSWTCWKFYQNTHYPRFSFIPNTDIAFPKTGVLFLLCMSVPNLQCGKQIVKTLWKIVWQRFVTDEKNQCSFVVVRVDDRSDVNYTALQDRR